jgi:hypothetical protein
MTTTDTAVTLIGAEELTPELAGLLEELDATPEPVKAAADEAPEGTEEPEETVEAEADQFVPEHVEGDLKEMAAAVTEKAKKRKAEEVTSEFERRAAYEKSKNPDNAKMATNLSAYAKKMATLPLCAILAATDIDPGFLNREISAGKRFNVYAIDKVNDVLVALETGHMKNQINAAVMRSLFKFRAAGVPFTGAMAVAAASDKVKIEKAVEKLLVRYTVSPATAPTQSSSTMNALQTLGIVINRGTQKFPVWVLTDTPQTRRLEEVLAA